MRDAARLGQAIARAGDRLGVDATSTWGGRSNATPSGAPPSTRRTATWSSGGRPCSIPPLPGVRDAPGAPRPDARSLWRRLGRRLGARLQRRSARRTGFLPGAALQQRTLFDEVVRPLTAGAGYDRATSSSTPSATRWARSFTGARGHAGDHRRSSGPGSPSCRPSTEVGMNVLAPVADNGRLPSRRLPTGRCLGLLDG